jgi:hypothetical protein
MSHEPLLVVAAVAGSSSEAAFMGHLSLQVVLASPRITCNSFTTVPAWFTLVGTAAVAGVWSRSHGTICDILGPRLWHDHVGLRACVRASSNSAHQFHLLRLGIGFTASLSRASNWTNPDVQSTLLALANATTWLGNLGGGADSAAHAAPSWIPMVIVLGTEQSRGAGRSLCLALSHSVSSLAILFSQDLPMATSALRSQALASTARMPSSRASSTSGV